MQLTILELSSCPYSKAVVLEARSPAGSMRLSVVTEGNMLRPVLSDLFLAEIAVHIDCGYVAQFNCSPAGREVVSLPDVQITPQARSANYLSKRVDAAPYPTL